MMSKQNENNLVNFQKTEKTKSEFTQSANDASDNETELTQMEIDAWDNVSEQILIWEKLLTVRHNKFPYRTKTYWPVSHYLINFLPEFNHNSKVCLTDLLDVMIQSKTNTKVYLLLTLMFDTG